MLKNSTRCPGVSVIANKDWIVVHGTVCRWQRLAGLWVETVIASSFTILASAVNRRSRQFTCRTASVSCGDFGLIRQASIRWPGRPLLFMWKRTSRCFGIEHHTPPDCVDAIAPRVFPSKSMALGFFARHPLFVTNKAVMRLMAHMNVYCFRAH